MILSMNHSNFREIILARIKLIDKRWVVPIVILMVLFLAAQYGRTSSTLYYDRSAILDGEVYRLLTFHFIHLSNADFLINIVALAALWLLYGGTMRTLEWMGAVVGCGSAIGLSLLLFSPEVEWSVGLSGLLYALFALVAIRAAMSGEYLSGAVVAFLVVKVILEQTIGPSAAMEDFIGSAIVVDTHMYGVIAGLVFGTIFGVSDRLAKSLPQRISGLAIDSGSIDRE